MITLIVVFCNRFRYVPDVVSGILSQNCADLFRIVFVDSGSTDPTRSYLAKTAQDHIEITLRRYEENLGKPRLANKEIIEASTEFVLLMDGDIVLPAPNTIGRLLAAFATCRSLYSELALLSPRYIPFVKGVALPDCDVPPPAFSTNGFSFSFAQHINVAGGCNLIQRDCYTQVGGFAQGPVYGDDVSLFLRLRANRFLSAYVSEVKVKHLGDLDAQYYPKWQDRKTIVHRGPEQGKLYEDVSELF